MRPASRPGAEPCAPRGGGGRAATGGTAALEEGRGPGQLAEEACRGGEGTFCSSVATLSAWALGCGVLSLPKVFVLCGVPWSLAFLLLFACSAEVALRWIVACGRYSGRRSFRSNAEFFLGPAGGRVVHYGQVALLFFGIVSVFVLTAALLPCLARDVLEAMCASDRAVGGGFFGGVCSVRPAQCMPREQMMLLVTLVVFPLACRKSLHALRGISALGLCSVAYFSLVLLLRFAGRVASGPQEHGGLAAAPATKGGDRSQGSFWQGPPMLLVSFMCHTSILQLDAELRPDSKQEVGAVIRTVIQRLALPLYAFVGLGGFAIFGASVSSNVLEDFEGDVLMSVARLALGLLNMAKIPLGVVTLREDLVRTMPWLPKGPTGRALVTAALLAPAAAVSAFTASLSSVLSLMGCTVGVLFCLCLPAALYWRLLGRLAPSKGSLREPLGGAERRSPPALAGVVSLPRSRRGWLLQRAACAAVFLGGLTMGALGFASWLGRAA